MYLLGSISLCLQLSITEYMKALSTAELSLPILPALRRFILSFLTLCSLILFDTSTSPLSSTRFIAGHSALAYRMAFFSSSPHPASSDRAWSASLSYIDRIKSAVLPGLSLATYLSALVMFCSLKQFSFAKTIPILSMNHIASS